MQGNDYSLARFEHASADELREVLRRLITGYRRIQVNEGPLHVKLARIEELTDREIAPPPGAGD
jgi:hypothetical protein